MDDEFQKKLAAIAAQRDEVDRQLKLLTRTVEHERAITQKIAKRADRLFIELEELRKALKGGGK